MQFRLPGRPLRIVMAGVFLLVIVPLLYVGSFLVNPPGEGKNVQLFDFGHGFTLTKMARDLEAKGIISSARLFIIYTKLKGAESSIKAGIYQFDDGLPPGEILRKMIAGEVATRKFSVPEGYSMYQVAEMLDTQGLFQKEHFLRLCKSAPFLGELGIDAKSVEGYLYPCTYDITPKTDEAGLIRMMVEQFDKVYARRFAERVKGSGLGKHEVITLASIIDKEAVVPEERPLIASVFHNRLKRGMPLQSDPTAVYGLRAFGGKVSKRDILRSTPYNTYVIKGLPPGPIGNPSSEAVEAVLAPAKTGYLYFVSRKDGSHHFSATLDEHNRAVTTYLKQN